MNNATLKSIWAVLAGFIFVVIVSITTDLLLTKTGSMEQPFHLNSVGFIIFVISYRSLFGIIGSYLTAKISPSRPMFHSIIGGIIGFVIATIGAIAMWDRPPHWYAIALIIATLPCAWLGGHIYILIQQMLNDNESKNY